MKAIKVSRFWLRRHVTSNPASRRRFNDDPPQLHLAQEGVLQDLNAHGVAHIPFEALFPAHARGLWDELEQLLQQFMSSGETTRRIEDYRTGRRDEAFKGYMIKYIDRPSAQPVESPLVRFGLHAAILDVVNAYFGMCVKLNAMNFWYTLPCDQAADRRASQRWHRDPEDRSVIKVFAYFTDVDEDAGPFEYIPGSRAGGAYSSLWRFARGDGVGGYPPQDVIESTVPFPERRAMTGPRGTIVFCDTSGLHRGGFGKTRERVLATWAYVSPASLHARNYRIDRRSQLAIPYPPARYAVA